MALFTDPNVVTLEDLQLFEASLAQVAAAHGINVDTKINLSLSAISGKLLLWLLNSGGADPQWLNRRLLGLTTVVVTPALQRWICFDALSRFYSEAYNVQLNTRFEGKWTEYQQESDDRADMVFMSGVGIVYKPLPKPAMPLVSVQTGSLAAESVFVQVAWVGATGSESAVSAINGLILPANSSFTVATYEGAVNAPVNATGWNLYAGNSSGQLTLQNSAPLALGSTWTPPGGGVVVGSDPSGGQTPDFYVALARRIQRG
jgi:hypothetical protein